MKIQAHLFAEERKRTGAYRENNSPKRVRPKSKSNLQIIQKINDQSE